LSRGPDPEPIGIIVGGSPRAGKSTLAGRLLDPSATPRRRYTLTEAGTTSPCAPSLAPLQRGPRGDRDDERQPRGAGRLTATCPQRRPAPRQIADQFEAKLLWMGEHARIPDRPYLIELHDQETIATITAIKYREDATTGAHVAAKTLARNDIGVVNISTGEPLAFGPYSANRALGGFLVLDKLTRETVGRGTIDFALRRAANVHWQALALDKEKRASVLNQKPICIWFAGLPGSGRSTIANLLEKRLHAAGKHAHLLDGDNVRHGLSRDLGFTEADRVENIRRVAEVAKLMVDAGLIVLVFVDTSLEECEWRDPKGLYAKARRVEVKNFT
jgi:bifunctional enzyme CysN/CysC